METTDLNDRLSRISTQWAVVFQAHYGESADLGPARQELLQRYRGAVYRYLLGAVRDPDTAADLAQEFALRLVRGDFRRADPLRGRFRDYLKTAVIHLVTDYHRARKAWPDALGEIEAPAAFASPVEPSFEESWRQEVLDRTWNALRADQPTYHAVLLLRVADPELQSREMAEKLSKELGRPLTGDYVRKALERAHRRFAELLVEEVAQSLGTDEGSDLEAELADLDLLKYCRSAVARRAAGGKTPQ